MQSLILLAYQLRVLLHHVDHVGQLVFWHLVNHVDVLSHVALNLRWRLLWLRRGFGCLDFFDNWLVDFDPGHNFFSCCFGRLFRFLTLRLNLIEMYFDFVVKSFDGFIVGQALQSKLDVLESAFNLGVGFCYGNTPNGSGHSELAFGVVRLVLEDLLALVDDLVKLLLLKLAVCNVSSARHFKGFAFWLRFKRVV